jgi:CHAD domain-containing protein
MKKKWKITGLKKSKKLKQIANIILRQRIESLLDLIKKYLNDKNIENLHDVRISLRRVRYNLELFLVCYDQSTFSKFYFKVEKLQNLSGEGRDLDVLLLNLENLRKSSVEIDEIIKQKIIENRTELEKKLVFELKKFLRSKALNQFLKELN